MNDPVTGFTYPEAWIDNCSSPGKLALVRRGLAVLTATGLVLRRGFTTGTTAAAACKAAILSLNGNPASVPVTTPCGIIVDVPVTAAAGRAECRKYAGDYPNDATAGIAILATAVQQEAGLDLVPGPGIGRYARTTPRFSKGTPAITPAPLSSILRSMEEALEATGLSGARVFLEVPDGGQVAARTLNAKVGIEGGISILGTTGLVEPWDDHLTGSALERIRLAKRVVLTTGRTGLRHARLRYPEHEIVLVGSKIERALSAANGDVILFGLPALILKFINPRILEGTGCATVEELSVQPAFSGILEETLAGFRMDHPGVRVVIISRSGDIVGESP